MLRYVLIVMMFLPLASLAAIYKSVDDHGNTSFSDEPSSHAIPVILNNAQTYHANAPIQHTAIAEQSSDSKKNTVLFSDDYQITITTPLNNSTFWLGGEPITVSATIHPVLERGNKAVLLYDNQPLESSHVSGSHVNFTLVNYQPGKHTLSVSVRRANGSIVKTSTTYVFYVLIHHQKLK